MARAFTEAGIPRSPSGATAPTTSGARPWRDLAAGRVNVVFSVDLFNEGVDVPAVDTLLLLRPTDSPTLFLQQLGRGLRRAKARRPARCSTSSAPAPQGVPLRPTVSGAARRHPQGPRASSSTTASPSSRPAATWSSTPVARKLSCATSGRRSRRRWTAKVDGAAEGLRDGGHTHAGDIPRRGRARTSPMSTREQRLVRPAARRPAVHTAGPRTTRAACGRAAATIVHVDDEERLTERPRLGDGQVPHRSTLISLSGARAWPECWWRRSRTRASRKTADAGDRPAPCCGRHPPGASRAARAPSTCCRPGRPRPHAAGRHTRTCPSGPRPLHAARDPRRLRRR